MGQKTNPNIFRLGVNKTWKTEFFEKKRHELPLYTFKDLEIKSYVERFLQTQGIFLHDYKQHFSNSTLNLYISYFVSPDFLLGKKDKTNKIILVNKLGQKKIITEIRKKSKSDLIRSNSFLKKFTLFNARTLINSYQIKKYLKPYFNDGTNLLDTTSLMNLRESPKLSAKHCNKVIDLKIEGVLNHFLKVLSLFTNNKFNIIINFCCINKDLNFLKNTHKKTFLLLQKFRNTPFLKEGIELLFHVVYNTNSANLLAKFIALQIKKIKRHKFFLSFLKQTLTILSQSNFSKVKGIKILVKGRLNGVPRAKHKMLTIGDVPVQSISVNVDYSQVTTHNANGSYGITVWIIRKN
jgi:ribosomal protein S3